MIFNIRTTSIFLAISLSFVSNAKELKDPSKVLKVLKSLEEKKDYGRAVRYLHSKKLYFTSIFYSKKYINEKNKNIKEMDKFLTKIILKTGPQTYFDIKDENLASHLLPSLSFVLTLKNFKKNSFQKAIKFSQLIPENHRFFPETTMVVGSSYYFLGNFKKANVSFLKCYKSSQDLENDSNHKKLKRYYAIIKENCLINLARISYKKRQYKKSLWAYEKISKNSYLWPYLLMERAWANFQLNDYNRALGISVAYKSPLLTSYFLPEVEVLKALSYYKLCQYEDALLLIDQYYKVFKPKSERLRKLISENKGSKLFFYKLMIKKGMEKSLGSEFIINLKTQTKKRIKYSLDWLAVKKIYYELKQVRNFPKSNFRNKIYNRLTNFYNQKRSRLNYFVKKEFYSYINNIHKFSYELFKIRLEIYSKKRDLIYNKSKIASKRDRGNKKNIKRQSDQFLWDFRGEFWADELGDYSFGLESKCTKIEGDA